ncbi:MAG: hypothetical protein ONB06_06185, partial [candidate division KSB1 bacterium]|nr:hypothetical protein [candidate division KSB1 bacterium]
VVPCFFVVELLAPVVETVGIGVAAIAYLFDQLNVSFAVWFFLVAYGFGMLLSLASLVLEEWRFARFASWHDRVRFVVWAVLEYIGYHQLTVWFRLRGLLRFLKGRKDWGGHAPAGIWLAGSEALHPVRTYAGGNGLLPPASVRERRLMLSKLNVIQWGIVGVTSLGLGVGSGWAEETIALTQAIPDNLARIEVVWPTGGPPSVTLNPPVEPQSIGSIRWTGTRVTVVPLAEQMRPFGACQVRIEKLGEAIRLQMEGTPKPTCGVIWWLGHPDAALDLLSFNQLSVEGIARGSFDLGIVDRWWWEKQDSMTLFRTTGSFRIGIPLSAIADRVDLRQVVALTVAVSRTPAVVTIEPVRFEARKLAPPAPKLGLWVWNVRRAIQEPDQVLSTCVAMGCRRVSIQMPGANATEETWRAYLAVVRRWQEQGIEVYALDGDPHAVVNPRYLVAGIERLTTTGKGETLPTGLQLDIEPYVLQEFQTDPERYRDYLTLLAQLRRTMPAGLPLSVVVPFWFSGLMVEGRPLAFHVQDLADEVVVMNYRVELSEARRLIEDWVRYGALIGKPVWGAIETRPLPDERHLVFRRVERPEQATAYLDRCAQQLVLAPPPQKAAHLLYFAEMVRYDVLGSRLSFAGRSKEALKTALDQWVRDVTVPTVTGLMIHDWEGYEQLFDGPPRQPAGPH